MTRVVDTAIIGLSERIRIGQPLVFDADFDALSIYDVSPEDWPSFIRSTNDDLSFHVRAVHGFLDIHFLNPNEPVPPHFPNRILVMLRKARRYDLERRLLTAYCLRFPTAMGATHVKMLERAEKLGILDGGESEKLCAARLMAPEIKVSIAGRVEEAPGSFFYTFIYECRHCGGTKIETADTSDHSGDMWCDACGCVLGTLGGALAISEVLTKESMVSLGHTPSSGVFREV